MDLLSRIASWLGENEATISAVVGITVLAGVLFAGLRSLVRRRAETAPEKAPGVATEEASAAEISAPDLDPLTVPGFEGRPAIAVLPFDNLSGDPDQEYFADGIAEDLITRLSAWRDFPVIARNSSFTYKGKAVDVKHVSRELGVRYVVEGSVRKSGERVRISAQLIDATTGAHVWAETYDRELRDIFALQDEITGAIVASMYPSLGQSERERAARREPENLEAWDHLQRGLWHLHHITSRENIEARRMFEKAIEMDPLLGSAFAALAWSHYSDVVFGWSNSSDRSIGEMLQAAETGVALDDKDAMAHLALAGAYSSTGQREKALSATETALELNPNLSAGYYWRGVHRNDLADLERAIRLSPQDPLLYLFLESIGFRHLIAGGYEEAVDWAQRSLQRRPGYFSPHLLIAASYAHLGRMDEAHAAVREVLKLEHGFSLATAQAMTSFWEPADREPYIDALRKAGLPE